jgi:hypothetical protein
MGGQAIGRWCRVCVVSMVVLAAGGGEGLETWLQPSRQYVLKPVDKLSLWSIPGEKDPFPTECTKLRVRGPDPRVPASLSFST